MNGRESGIIQNKFSRLSLIVGLDRMKQTAYSLLYSPSFILPSYSLLSLCLSAIRHEQAPFICRFIPPFIVRKFSFVLIR